jgi:amidohydrolase
MPWPGVDPIVLTSQIVLALQTIQSRQVDVTSGPSVLTIASLHAGNRANIISDKAEMEGTLRTFDLEMRSSIKQRVTETAELIAKSGGGDALVEWRSGGAPPLVNNAELTSRMVPTLQRIVGANQATESKPLMISGRDAGS